MRFAQIRDMDISNGPGIRVSIFLQGCDIKCPGCFNSSIWNFEGGKQLENKDIICIEELLKNPYIDGLSILGGEPLSKRNLKDLKEFISYIKEKSNKSIWIYSGYTYENITKEQLEIVSLCDILVDGPFIEKLKDSTLKFRGSSNQRLIDIKETLNCDKIILWNG